VETFEDLNTDTRGLSAMIYVPPIVGNYYVTLYFPEQELEYATLGLPAGTMLASQTDRRELVVVDVQQEYHPGFNLPEEYWTRPIDSQLREWSRITGNWLEVHENVGNRYAPNNEYAPETAHILWARPLSKGGLAGGAQGHHGYSEGDAYEGLYQNDIIIGGKLYYNLLNTRTQGVLPPESQEVVAVDLHTGEVDWQKPLQTPDGSIRNLAFGQQMFWDAFNHHAVYSYLWSTAGSTWHAFDPFTGDWSYSIENVPSGTRVHGPNGELLVYTINIDGGWMSLWNNVKTVNPQDYGNSNDGSWGRNIGLDAEYSDRVYDAERGMVWNVSIPDLPPLSAFYSTLIMEDRIIGSNTGNIFGGPQTDPEFWALSLQPGHEGTLMWREPWTPPVADLWVHFTPNFQPSLEDGVFIVQAKETGQNWGFDIDSGEEIWGPTDPLPDIATATNLYFPRWGQAVGSDGIVVLGGGMGGVLRGHEIATGKELWEYEFPDEYKEILWSTNWPAVPQFVADGKVYVAHQEHSPLDPKPRGAPFVVLDLETGTEVFTADGMFRSTRWGGQAIIGDSIMAAMDTYDQRVYAVGRGPSAIAVEKPQAVAEMGSAVTIQGTVMDVSPGTQDAATKLRFPYGVPAVSDAGQSEWMLYVYKNYERPMDAIGVTVKVEVIAPSGNPESMDATSDSYGNWALGFCPEETGTYTIVATFEGSKAYYGSTQTTYLTVAEPVGGADTSDLEDSVNSVDESVTNLTTYVMAILVLVIIALLIAIYVLLRK
ncbi:MAG: hypothetical protein CW716_12635, partial [Candidatus Bathyarchaeum sp.]